jgi:hypothetical protein
VIEWILLPFVVEAYDDLTLRLRRGFAGVVDCVSARAVAIFVLR